MDIDRFRRAVSEVIASNVDKLEWEFVAVVGGGRSSVAGGDVSGVAFAAN